MPSHFPGMDPYVEDEKVWPDFQHHLIMAIYHLILPGLADRYRARVGQRQYETEQALFTSLVREEHSEEYIEVRQRSDGKLITVVDVVSPSNKTTTIGRQKYLDRRRESRNHGASMVEIDLVLQGQPTLDYSRDNLPEWDYAVTVTRSTQPERHEIYTATLQKRLPRFRLPLSADDRDTVMDLQACFLRAYEQGGFGARIDYRRDPPTRLEDDDRDWLDKLLKEHKLR
jgi:hypothetical protein